MIHVKLSSIFVNDQEKALHFYTEILGLVKKVDVPAGEYKWLTVGSADSDFQMLLEPNVHPAAQVYQKALFSDKIPATMLFVDDIDAEYSRLKNKGVEFTSAPVQMGPVKIAALNDTCGNWIQLCQ